MILGRFQSLKRGCGGKDDSDGRDMVCRPNTVCTCVQTVRCIPDIDASAFSGHLS